jgi:aspartate/methionine/tyrosine aminotransferase
VNTGQGAVRGGHSKSALGEVAERVSHLRQPGWRATEEQVADLRSQGFDVLEVYGMPIRPLPEHIVKAVHEVEHELLVPPPSRGLPELREAIAGKMLAENGLTVDSETEILVTNGAMQAVNVVCRTLLNPGDEVLIPSPSFFFYGMVELAGGQPVYVRMKEDARWAWDLDAIADAITEKTKLLILCNPVNPTGYVVPDVSIEAIVRMAADRGVYVLSDESYDRMVYDAVPFHSAARFQEHRDGVILVQSITKSYAMSAWRIGYVVANAELSASFAKILEWEGLYGNVVCQRAAAAAIAGPQEWLSDIADEFEGYRNEVWPRLDAIAGLSAVQPSATPYFLLNVSRLGVAGDAFAESLVRDFGVPATGGSHFDAPDHVRIGFGAPRKDTREELCRRVEEAAGRWSERAAG